MPPGAPGMGNVFVNQGGVLKRVCIKENFNPACCDSRLSCGQRPVENCCTAHNTAVSGCAWSHPGDSSGSCVPWNPAHCGAETKENCILPGTNHNVAASNPRCKSGWTGSCSYRCNDGNFDKITNSCKKNCSSKEFPIAGTRCVLPASNHHAAARRTGRCTSSYGACSGRCNNGNWEGVANTCYTPRGCGGRTISNCRMGGGTHNSHVNGSCINNTTGNCGYHCVDSVWKWHSSRSHYTCRQRRSCTISASSYPGCPLTGTRSHGWNISGLNCSSGYTGTCSASCNDGALAVTNNCTQSSCTYAVCSSNACNNPTRRTLARGEMYNPPGRHWFLLSGRASSCGSVSCNSYGEIVGSWCSSTRSGGGSGGGGGGCFIADTLITMFNGSKKPIQDIVKGDQVLGQSGINIVTEVKKHYARPFSGLVYSINGSRSFVTGGHPFMTTQGWKAFNIQTAKRLNPVLDIQPLKIGDILLKENGKQEVLRDYKSEYQDTKIYNFTVDGDKTYYADGWLVHNK